MRLSPPKPALTQTNPPFWELARRPTKTRPPKLFPLLAHELAVPGCVPNTAGGQQHPSPISARSVGGPTASTPLALGSSSLAVLDPEKEVSTPWEPLYKRVAPNADEEELSGSSDGSPGPPPPNPHVPRNIREGWGDALLLDVMDHHRKSVAHWTEILRSSQVDHGRGGRDSGGEAEESSDAMSVDEEDWESETEDEGDIAVVDRLEGTGWVLLVGANDRA
ncbi:64cde6fa-0f9d-4e30-a1a5-bbbf4817c917 [Thermothielavioides terrestris]|uniref:64cde6fa-0f9d-4e30-a1a5-bbbf4817c917 n=1 Tax=Thermothielavioides terrestris TaxID=2587410 RepID=A0A3S4BMQ1_9PEZI|nr:64cde6fa-0f9d-4e30-a1a5-bbbf4817c917 [Thermothielavioides terrestris]